MKLFFKKTCAAGLVLLQFFLIIPHIKADMPEPGKQTFMVSAYYSPLPGQSFYMRGSYEADKRLNGNGTNGADGAEVFAGMLAAPGTYPFGTRIRIPGLGVGTVHDRGGAILAYREYDRIDVWMGKGEEGLARALNWGMRLLDGEIYSGDDAAASGLDFSRISDTLPESRIARMKANALLKPEVFENPVTENSPAMDIMELQEALRLFGFYEGAVSGEFNIITREALINFQLSEGIIKNKDEAGAGVFSPQTSTALKARSENLNSKVFKEQRRLKENIDSLTSGLGKNDSGENVRKLQQLLWEIGYYRESLNGIYNSLTIDAVFEFQKDFNVVENVNDPGAGFFGRKTHTALIAAIGKRMAEIPNLPAEMQSWMPAQVDLPKLSDFSGNVEITKRSLSFDRIVVTLNTTATAFTENLSKGDKGETVVKLQNILIRKNYLSAGRNTGYFGQETASAMIKFQKDRGIIKKTSDPGAGNVGPKTREELNKL